MTTGENEYRWHSNYNLEVAILYSIAALGICLNIFQSVCILIEREFRNLLSAFIIHGALINAVLASYCVIFALSLHDKSFQNACKYLGSSFIVIMTANIVNLIAIIASEVYKLNNMEHSFKNAEICDGKLHCNHSSSSNVNCIMFGLVIVYVASLILHLGPTVIAGNFSYDDKTGFCLFIYGQRKNYVVFVVWIVIVTLVLSACSYYLYTFHFTINTLLLKELHREPEIYTPQSHLQEDEGGETNLQDDVVQPEVARGSTVNSQLFRQELLLTKSRAWTLSCVTGLHVLCWYPLFCLLVSDRNFRIPIGLYRAFTCLAWSNSFLEPLLYLLLDRKTSRLCWRLLLRHKITSRSLVSRSGADRIGDRLKSVATLTLDSETPPLNCHTNPSHIELTEFPKFHIKSPPPLVGSNNFNSVSVTVNSLNLGGPTSIGSNKSANNTLRNINYIEC